MSTHRAATVMQNVSADPGAYGMEAEYGTGRAYVLWAEVANRGVDDDPTRAGHLGCLWQETQGWYVSVCGVGMRDWSGPYRTLRDAHDAAESALWQRWSQA